MAPGHSTSRESDAGEPSVSVARGDCSPLWRHRLGRRPTTCPRAPLIMLGTTLTDIRDRLESLANPNGRYHLTCGRTGDSPVPADGLRFDSRETAREAAKTTEQYRRALRRYDPRVPYYDLIVREDHDDPTKVTEKTDRGEASDWALGDPVVGRRPEPSRRRRVEFCHRVAAAIFEALSKGDNDIERAVMDAYVDLAERVVDPDDLCLCLLESMATELDRQLTADQQSAVLGEAAAQFPGADGSERPVTAALSELRGRGLIESFSAMPAAIDPASGRRSVLATLSGYALSAVDERLPVLPVVITLYRYGSPGSLAGVHATEIDGGWRLTIEFDDSAVPVGLSSAPIEPT